MKHVAIPAGTPIFEEGNRADTIYLVLRGSVALHRRKPEKLERATQSTKKLGASVTNSNKTRARKGQITTNGVEAAQAEGKPETEKKTFGDNKQHRFNLLYGPQESVIGPGACLSEEDIVKDGPCSQTALAQQIVDVAILSKQHYLETLRQMKVWWKHWGMDCRRLD